MSQAVATVEPKQRRWTRGEFYRLAELGLFQGQRAELIEGEIMVLSPQNWPHAVTVDRAAEVLRIAFGDQFWVRAQLPINLSLFISVVAGRREDYTDHPTNAVLLVEVSDTTLAYDQGHKASLYASAGIADYWIVNLVDRQLEVHRNPVADPSQPLGHSYADVKILSGTEHVSPLAAHHTSLPVADLLP